MAFGYAAAVNLKKIAIPSLPSRQLRVITAIQSADRPLHRGAATEIEEIHQYIYAGGKLLRETISDGTTTKTLDFSYDNVGMPYSLIYNDGTTTTTYYYITNLQGDVMYLVDANGVQVAAYDYDPYGKVITSTGELAGINSLRYRGYYYDSETGFYYLQSRYYDPEICRFINADSYASTGDGFTGLNMFAFCNNNPANRIDPDGHDSYVWEWITTMWWLCLVDGPYPIADAIYVVGAVGILVIDHVITFSNSQRAMLEVEEYIANTDAKSTILESKESKDTKKKKNEKSGKQKSENNTPKNNQAQNKQVESIARKLKMTKSQQRELHDIISKQGYSYQEILEIACDIMGVYFK